MFELAIPVAIGVAVVFVLGLLFARLYRRSTRDEAYVRTGLGGQKVVLDGGSLVLPVFHSVAAVNLKTLRLEVARGGPDSLITKDRMRVDIAPSFICASSPTPPRSRWPRRRSATAPMTPLNCANWSKPNSSTACDRLQPP